MDKVIVNKSYISKKLTPTALREYKKNINPIINKKVGYANNKLLQDFLNTEIAKEIQAGSNASNTSNLLSGRGNLFTFLGYQKSDKPIQELSKFLANSIKVESISISASTNAVQININIPTLDDMDGIAELPWINKSLAKAIEKGISGLGNYLYSEKGFDVSRSGKAIQTKTINKSQRLSPNPFITKIIKDIAKKLVMDIKSNI